MKVVFQIFFILLVPCVLQSVSAQQTSSPFKLSGVIQGSGDVDQYQISPDGRWVVFLADASVDEKIELYSVPIQGGIPTKLNVPLGTNQDVVFFKISPDSKHVVFVSDLITDNKQELFIVPIQGRSVGSLRQLNALDMSDNTDVEFNFQFAYAPERAQFKVVFQIRETISQSPSKRKRDLFSVNINGGGLTQINFPDTRPNRAQVSNFSVSPDSTQVGFVSSSSSSFLDSELFVVDVDGNAQPIKLSRDIGVNNYGRVDLFTLEYNPTSTHIVFSQTLNNRRQLHSVPSQGGTPILLQDVNENSTGEPLITNDSQRVIYMTGSTFDSDIYSVPLTGGAPVLLGNTNFSRGVRLVDNDSRIVFGVETNLLNLSELHSIPVTGGTPQVLSNPGGSSIPSAELSSNRQLYVTIGRVNINGVNDRFELRSVPFSGGAVNILSEDSFNPVITPNSQQVVYLRRTRNANDDLILSLSVVDIGGGDEHDLSGALPFMSSLTTFQLTPDGKFAVFRADKDIFDKFELFAVRLPESQNDDFCIPIKAKNGKVAIICL